MNLSRTPGPIGYPLGQPGVDGAVATTVTSAHNIRCTVRESLRGRPKVGINRLSFGRISKFTEVDLRFF
jgi:hypothetical protein